MRHLLIDLDVDKDFPVLERFTIALNESGKFKDTFAALIVGDIVYYWTGSEFTDDPYKSLPNSDGLLPNQLEVSIKGSNYTPITELPGFKPLAQLKPISKETALKGAKSMRTCNIEELQEAGLAIQRGLQADAKKMS